MGRQVLSRVKAVLLPQGKRCRRLPFGIARGIDLDIDFANQTKLFFGLYEVEVNKHLRRLCRPGFNCFDVGGQFGYDALVLAKLSGGRVMSFECDPTASSELACNVANNARFRDNIRVVHAFVTAQTNGERGEVALDDVAFGGEGFVPDFIKMDIEGAELDALRGARRILQERHPNLLVETHSRQLETDCLTFVESLGYATTVLAPRSWLRDYRPVEHNRWFAATYDGAVNHDARAAAPTSRRRPGQRGRSASPPGATFQRTSGGGPRWATQ